ncbi:NADH dehydrogenase (quinone) [Anaeromyxobacter dehalogenans 2CP-1]|uniref:NADH dehydrogenase (Quinone) n=1 Tax=Anaeromyxobacter dehalogenans (strain ATCC BAA-258 / DSM 21875 / 2CP-1) TaxID=455488 RepID=B8J7E0_ANAD2|nr:proton-conducting transporter membrane subunit [Anaeromyxobacter dehalogenans]ACL67120.1 NADH dehydrogenase (quinone) [Anaeromyxobacter dehalogenans 2CP-1]
MTSALALGAIALTAASGLAAALPGLRPARAQALATAVLCAGAALGLAAAGVALAGGEAAAGGVLRVDALSGLFLVPILGIAAAGSAYGLRYFPQAERGARAVRLQLFYGLAVAGMALLVCAPDAIGFLVGWEVMALANFFMVQTEDEDPSVRRGAFLYLAATHAGTLALFALFALLRREAGTFELAAMEGLRLSGPTAAAVLALALAGFGMKAGLVPLHFWLPPAHAAAPSHVSALMSGVVVKTGIYGLMRVTGLVESPPESWGVALLALGGVSAVLGVAFALAQHDLKRLLAYHTVENVGIIALGLGLALLGRARGVPALVVLGLGGAGLHVVNHALFKSLLFLGAGAVHHATGTRDLDHLGGLARAMPRTALLFVVGAAAISGLPPLNGFASEWLVYLGLLDGLRQPGGDLLAYVTLGAPALALVGGLAAACFAKVVGVVFLGSPRSHHADGAHEPPAAMLAPMALLAAACAAIGLFPAATTAPLARAAAAWARVDPALLAAPAARAAAGAARVSAVAAVLLVATLAVAAWRRRRLAGRIAPAVQTWGCAFSAPTARMQYTGSSLAALLVARFSWAVHPRRTEPRLEGPFPAPAPFATTVPDTVLDLALLPAARAYGWIAERARLLYLRRIHFQMLLVLVTLLAVLAWGFAW